MKRFRKLWAVLGVALPLSLLSQVSEGSIMGQRPASSLPGSRCGMHIAGQEVPLGACRLVSVPALQTSDAPLPGGSHQFVRKLISAGSKASSVVGSTVSKELAASQPYALTFGLCRQALKMDWVRFSIPEVSKAAFQIS